MGKVLRVLVIVVFVLGLAALVLAGLNFGKREVLIGRTHALEEMFVKLAKTLEAQDPADLPQPSYPQRDVSPVTSQPRDNPEVSAFWDSYNHKYEPAAQPIPTLDFGTEEKRLQLRQYYRIDPATGKPAISALTGKPDASGTGTLDELLQEAFKRAVAQNAMLQKTRAELPKLREELVSVIEELNRVKRDGRADKKQIEELNARIVQLEDEKRQLEGKIVRLEEEKRAINAELQEKVAEIAGLNEEIEGLKKTVETRDETIKKLKGKGPVVPVDDTIAPGTLDGLVAPGDKGKIVSVNEQWKFVVVEFSDAFMTEILGEGREKPMPLAEMMVRRQGMESAAGDFVTRVRLRQVIREQNLVVADILIDWQQVPVELGDVVYF